jgi:alkylated DNA repair dioxygenase AlkB
MSQERLEDGAVLLRGFAAAEAPLLVQEVSRITDIAPLRHLVTPGGYTMPVAMTNCGRVGWVSGRTGYRYDSKDPARFVYHGVAPLGEGRHPLTGNSRINLTFRKVF